MLLPGVLFTFLASIDCGLASIGFGVPTGKSVNVAESVARINNFMVNSERFSPFYFKRW